jgi:hypothetical protein
MRFKFKESDEPLYVSDGIFYALTEGYLNPEEILENAAQIEEIRKAVETLKTFQSEAIREKAIELG